MLELSFEVSILVLLDLVHVDSGLDILGFLTKLKGIDRFLVVLDNLCHSADYSSLGVTAQRILKNSGDLGVTIVDELLAARGLTESVDDVTEGKEGPVDVLAFSKSDTLSLCFTNTLTTGQINKVQL